MSMSNIYSGFAYIYDRLMSDIDYDEWADSFEKIFEKYSLKPKLIAELACGTGNICNIMAERGYDIIGIDLSEDMLNVAVQNAKDANLDILYLNQDMREFELYGTVDVIICMLDSINYITDYEDLEKVFRLVNNYLNPGGLFIFDVNSQHKLENILGNNTFAVDEDDIFYIWENNYDKKSRICEFFLTFFVKYRERYKRIDEYHRERAYSFEEIENALNTVGLKLLEASEFPNFKVVSNISERILFITTRNN